MPEEEQAVLEKRLGSYGAAGQMQQRPAPRSGGMFDRDWWNFCDVAPTGGRTVRGWDLAGSDPKKNKGAAWTAGVKMKAVNETIYIEDIVRMQGTPGKVERTIDTTAELDGIDVTIDLPQDPGQAGKSQVQSLVKMLQGYNVRYSPESGSKETRAEPLSAQAEAGNVYLVRGTWNQEFIDEAALFPNSDNKDQIDAASRAFHRLFRGEKRIGVQPPEVVNLGG